MPPRRLVRIHWNAFFLFLRLCSKYSAQDTSLCLHHCKEVLLYLSSTVIIPLEGTQLFTLFTCYWWTPLLFGVGAPLTPLPDECRCNTAVLTRCRLQWETRTYFTVHVSQKSLHATHHGLVRHIFAPLPFHKLSRFGNTFCKYSSMFCKTIRYRVNAFGCFIGFGTCYIYQSFGVLW